MPNPGPEPSVPLTVLLVDDDEGMRAAVGLMLGALGFRVLVAGDGLEALRIGEAVAQDLRLVLSDCAMPGMDGVDTVLALRKLRPGLKAILASGNCETDCLKGRVLEEYLFLAKPFGFQDLTDALNRVLGKVLA